VPVYVCVQLLFGLKSSFRFSLLWVRLASMFSPIFSLKAQTFKVDDISLTSGSLLIRSLCASAACLPCPVKGKYRARFALRPAGHWLCDMFCTRWCVLHGGGLGYHLVCFVIRHCRFTDNHLLYIIVYCWLLNSVCGFLCVN